MESKGQPEQPDRKKLRAYARAIRVKIMGVLAKRPATTRELAAETGEESLAIVAYHVRVLRECGAVEPDRGERGEWNGLYRARL